MYGYLIYKVFGLDAENNAKIIGNRVMVVI